MSRSRRVVDINWDGESPANMTKTMATVPPQTIKKDTNSDNALVSIAALFGIDYVDRHFAERRPSANLARTRKPPL